MAEKVAVRNSGSMIDELGLMHDRIVQRAYEIFCGNGHLEGRDHDNWLTAERELVWRPPLELEEIGDGFRVQVAVPGMASKDLDIQVDPEQLLVKGETQHKHHGKKGKVLTCEFQSGELFRSLRFPKKVDPDKVKAELENGVLTITAKIEGSAAAAKKVKVKKKPEVVAS